MARKTDDDAPSQRRQPPLEGFQRKYLRGLVHGVQPIVQVGQQGITEAVMAAIARALTDHELIKVRLGQNFEGDRHEAGDAIAAATGARVVQVIGRVIVLFRARPRDKKDTRPRIELPRG